jgi:hypothetical protein
MKVYTVLYNNPCHTERTKTTSRDRKNLVYSHWFDRHHCAVANIAKVKILFSSPRPRNGRLYPGVQKQITLDSYEEEHENCAISAVLEQIKIFWKF